MLWAASSASSHWKPAGSWSRSHTARVAADTRLRARTSSCTPRCIAPSRASQSTPSSSLHSVHWAISPPMNSRGLPG